MKIAIISDVHSSEADLRAVLAHAKRHTDVIYCLGDVFECHVGKKRSHLRFSNIDDVVTAPPSFCELLDFPSVIGNQEERILNVLIGRHDVKERIRTFPEKIVHGEALFIHGHQFEWDANWQPLVPKQEQPLVFIGHSHMPRLFRKERSLEFPIGQPITLKKKRYVINVGAVFFDREWCLYDDEARTVTRMRTKKL